MKKELSPKSIKIIVIIAAFIFIAIPIVMAIISYNNQEKIPVEIDHQGIESSLPNSEWDVIERFVFSVLRNTLGADDSHTIHSLIREGSYKESTNSNVLNVSFLIDVDEYKQTYEVSHAYSKTVEVMNGTTINCPTYDKMKYPGEKCIGMSNTSDSIEMYLPYTGKISSGEQFTVVQRYYFNGDSYLEIAIDSCGDQAVLDEALLATKNWLKSINIDPDLFSFELPAHYCPGGAA